VLFVTGTECGGITIVICYQHFAVPRIPRPRQITHVMNVNLTHNDWNLSANRRDIIFPTLLVDTKIEIVRVPRSHKVTLNKSKKSLIHLRRNGLLVKMRVLAELIFLQGLRRLASLGLLLDSLI
jgi:hypothetical protein